MTAKPFPRFRSLTTQHCVTGSMLHIYHFHGHPLSEEMLLGIGSGVGFIYWHMKGMPPFLGGRANVGRPGEEGLEISAGRRTGVHVQRFATGSAKKAEQALLPMLEAGQPVMLLVDMGFLPYFKDLPEDYHFGYHVVVACGYDPQTREVLIADRDQPLHPISWEQLAKARGSKFKPFPPRHTWFNFDFSQKRDPTPEEVSEAIRQMCANMLEGPISNLGVAGIRKAARAIPKWPDTMDAEALRWACFNAFIFIDAEGGTGGGIFRYMLGRFLQEASVITGTDRLAEIGQDFEAIGDRWQEVAQIFREGSRLDDPNPILAKTTAPLMEIADLEESAWRKLLALAEAP